MTIARCSNKLKAASAEALFAKHAFGMVRSIIHHHHHPSSRMLLHQQFFNKADEGRAILGLRRGPGDRILQPVVTTTKIWHFCFSPGLVAGIRLCCPTFIQHARSGGSSVMVVSSIKMSLKSSPRTFFSTPPAIY